MTTKEHYDNHLANFYSWMIGDFRIAKDAFKEFCINNDVRPFKTKTAIDLGAGNGVQSIALGEMGFMVKAVDFNKQLLWELESKIGSLPIETICDDIKNVLSMARDSADLIVCCGDTIAHLNTWQEINDLVHNCYEVLEPKGKFILSFRDYSMPLLGDQRFIPVKSDNNRILTCILEYSDDKVIVTDLLHEKNNSGDWEQRVSAYQKLRISTEDIIGKVQEVGFSVMENMTQRGMVHLVLEK